MRSHAGAATPRSQLCRYLAWLSLAALASDAEVRACVARIGDSAGGGGSLAARFLAVLDGMAGTYGVTRTARGTVVMLD